ncbi:MAG: FlgO family outer membrane protein [Bacteroidota bacterium]
MNRIGFVFLILSSLTQINISFGQDSLLNKNIAIAEFNTNGVPSNLRWLGSNFSDALITRFSNKNVRIIEREMFDKIIEQQKLQDSGLFSDSNAVKLGNLVGVQSMIFGSIAIVDNKVVARARIVNIESGIVNGSVEISGVQDKIISLQNDLANNLLSKMGLSNIGSVSVDDELPLIVIQSMDRLHRLSQNITLWGLDPARNRKKADYELALSICDNLLADKRESGLLHYYKALFNYHLEDYKTASNELEIAILKEPHFVDNYLLKGNLLITSIRDYPNAKYCFEKAESLSVNDSRPYYLLARLSERTDAKIDAYYFYIKALEHKPYIVQAETNLQSFLSSSSTNQAIDLAETKKIITNQEKIVYMLLKAYYGEQINFTNSVARELLLKYHPNWYLSWYLNITPNNVLPSIGMLKKAIAMNPMFLPAHKLLGQMYESIAECKLSEAHYRIYLDNTSNASDIERVEKIISNCKNNKEKK